MDVGFGDAMEEIQELRSQALENSRMSDAELGTRLLDLL